MLDRMHGARWDRCCRYGVTGPVLGDLQLPVLLGEALDCGQQESAETHHLGLGPRELPHKEEGWQNDALMMAASHRDE